MSSTAINRRVFDETSLHQAIIKTWGEHGAHNDVFKAMRNEIDLLRKVVDHATSTLDDEVPWLYARSTGLSFAEAAAVRRALDSGRKPA